MAKLSHQDDQQPTHQDPKQEESSASSEKLPCTQAALEQAQEEAARAQENFLRTRADLDNFRRRSQKEKIEAIQTTQMDLILDLLPLLDHFQMGLESAQSSTDPKVIKEGLSLIFQAFERFFKEKGVEVIHPENASFDPHWHECVAQESSDQVPSGQVLQVIRKGYKMNDRLLRAATVIVSSGPSHESPTPSKK